VLVSLTPQRRLSVKPPQVFVALVQVLGRRDHVVEIDRRLGPDLQ
jgi:hypothetical protein